MTSGDLHFYLLLLKQAYGDIPQPNPASQSFLWGVACEELYSSGIDDVINKHWLIS